MHLHPSFHFYLAELFLLRARGLRLLAALDARAFIMLTLAELGKRTRLGARTLETAQRAVNRLVFFDADLRHSFPSLRAFPSGGTLCTAPYAPAHKTVRILYLFLPSVSIIKLTESQSCSAHSTSLLLFFLKRAYPTVPGCI